MIQHAFALKLNFLFSCIKFLLSYSGFSFLHYTLLQTWNDFYGGSVVVFCIFFLLMVVKMPAMLAGLILYHCLAFEFYERCILLA